MTTIFQHNQKDYQINTEKVLFGKNQGQFMATCKGLLGYLVLKPTELEAIEEMKRVIRETIPVDKDLSNSELWD